MEKLTRYEVLMLAVPEITQDEIKDLEMNIDRVVQTGGGSMISFERWGKFVLSYPVRKNEYGVYVLARFQSKPNQVLLNEVRDLFTIKFENVVMRAVTTALDERVSLEYQRPRSLEEAPTREESMVERRSFNDEEEASSDMDVDTTDAIKS